MQHVAGGFPLIELGAISNESYIGQVYLTWVDLAFKCVPEARSPQRVR